MVTFCILFFQFSKFLKKECFLNFLVSYGFEIPGAPLTQRARPSQVRPLLWRPWIQWFFISNQSKIQWVGSYRSVSYTHSVHTLIIIYDPCWILYQHLLTLLTNSLSPAPKARVFELWATLLSTQLSKGGLRPPAQDWAQSRLLDFDSVHSVELRTLTRTDVWLKKTK